MKKVFLIHGYKGEPNGGWRPWIMMELGKREFWACAPQLPMAEGPKINEWLKELVRQVGMPNDDIFIIGHSLGATTTLRYLESLPIGGGIGGVILVSGPIRKLPQEKYRPIDNFFETEFDFDYIKKVCKNFYVIHGDNDESVPIAHAKELSEKLSCELFVVKNGSHLSGGDGWHQLPQALEVILKMLI